MRILHAADLHLDSPLRTLALRAPEIAERLRHLSRDVLERLVQAAIDNSVDALVLAGDVFDSDVADVSTRAHLSRQLGRLSRAGIPTVMIRGNHDALLDLDRYGPIAEGVTLLDRARPSVVIGDAAIHGIGFSARHQSESLLTRYPAPDPKRLNIGLMHTSLDGAPGHDRYAPCSTSDLLAFGYAYWALGHIHRRAVYHASQAVAVMPGIPQGRHIREPGRGSATLATFEAGGITLAEIPLAGLVFQEVDVDLSGVETQDQWIEQVAATCRALQTSEHQIALRLWLTGDELTGGDAGFASALAEQALEDLAEVSLDSVRRRESEAFVPPGALADLARMMTEDAQTPGFRDEAADMLTNWRSALPRDIAAELEDDALNDLIEQGVQAVMARLGRSGGPI